MERMYKTGDRLENGWYWMRTKSGRITIELVKENEVYDGREFDPWDLDHVCAVGPLTPPSM